MKFICVKIKLRCALNLEDGDGQGLGGRKDLIEEDNSELHVSPAGVLSNTGNPLCVGGGYNGREGGTKFYPDVRSHRNVGLAERQPDVLVIAVVNVTLGRQVTHR